MITKCHDQVLQELETSAEPTIRDIQTLSLAIVERKYGFVGIEVVQHLRS